MIHSLVLIAALAAPEGKAGLTALTMAASSTDTQTCTQVQRPNWMITTRRAPPRTERCEG